MNNHNSKPPSNRLLRDFIACLVLFLSCAVIVPVLLFTLSISVPIQLPSFLYDNSGALEDHITYGLAIGLLGAMLLFVGLITLYKHKKQLTFTLPWIVAATIESIDCLLVIADLKFGYYSFTMAGGAFWAAQLASLIAVVGGYIYYAVSLHRKVL